MTIWGRLVDRSTLRARIFWSLVPTLVAVFALVGLASIQLQRSLSQDQFQKRGLDIASTLAAASELGVIAEDAESLRPAVQAVGGDADVAYVFIYGPDGGALAASGLTRDAAPLSDVLREGMLREKGPSASQAEPSRRYLEFFAPILTTSLGTPDEAVLGLGPERESGSMSRNTGFVRVGLSLASVQRGTTALIRLWTGLAAGFVLLSLLSVYFVSQHITRPINQLTARARAIADGHLDQTIPVETRDEIGQLASTFNEMARSLESNIAQKESAMRDLRDLNQTLEGRIGKRTAELEQLYQLSASMLEPLSLRDALTRVLDGARELVGIDRLCVWALDADGEHLLTLATAGVPDTEFDMLQDTVLPFAGESALARVSREGVALLYVEGRDEPHPLGLEDQANPDMPAPDSVSVLLPLRVRGNAIGVLGCDNRSSRRTIGVATLRVLQTFAAHAASAIENAQLFRELEQKGREIEAANRHKSEFLANMSHELRTPLNAVIGFSEVLIERMFGELNDKQDEYLNDILGAGRHLLNLINDILDLSKIEAGQMELSPSMFDLPAALGNAFTLVKERAQRRGVKLRFDSTGCPQSVVADERKFKQVMLNLLTNAVKFTDEGGSVTVQARLAGDMIEFDVIDTGIGIAESDQERIFDAFRQAETEYTRKVEGTGLGLTLARRIVELHGGRLWVESELGEGSTFTFSLPLRDIAHAALSASNVGPPNPLRERRTSTSPSGEFVLVVEDDVASANLLSIHLRDSGIAVQIANDGRTGLNLARRLRPRAIVLDILLPELNGWEFLTALRSDPQIADIPVVIVSIVEERGKGLALGADDYLIKPYDPVHLVETIRRVYAAKPHNAAKTVLAIDDDPQSIELIRATLQPHGFHVLEALSGEEGIEMARAHVPDLIVLDLILPRMDGFETSKLLKDDPSTAHIPIVVLTMRSLSIAEKRRLQGRIAHLGRKSGFDREEFVKLVRAAIERRQQWERETTHDLRATDAGAGGPHGG